jgi:hypothetical protein
VKVPVPHPLSTVPQFLPDGHAGIGVQELAHVPFEHTIALGHAPFNVPQLTVPPQPLGIVPQLREPHAALAGSGVQPQTFAVPDEPPPQVCGDEQLPQLTVPPQPSDTVPQFLPPAQAAAVVFGVHPQALSMPPPPHVCGDTQLVGHTT